MMAPLSRHLAYSAALHFALLFALLIVAARSQPPRKFYSVQFLGGASGFGTGRLEPAPAPDKAPSVAPPKASPAAEKVKEKPRPSADKDKIAVSKEKGKDKKAPVKASPDKEAPSSAVPRSKGVPGGRGESAKGRGDSLAAKYGPVGGVGTALEIGGFGPGGPPAADSRFPFGWYINRIYLSLWNNWAYREVSTKECVVVFSIRRGGDATGVKVAEPSGDSLFDQLALRAVSNSTFPPLPEGYPEPDLPVFVRFRME